MYIKKIYDVIIYRTEIEEMKLSAPEGTACQPLVGFLPKIFLKTPLGISKTASRLRVPPLITLHRHKKQKWKSVDKDSLYGRISSISITALILSLEGKQSPKCSFQLNTRKNVF